MSPHASSEARFARMIEGLPHGVVVHDEHGTIAYANALAASLAAVDGADDLVGTPIASLFAPPYLKGVREHLLGLRAVDDRGAASERLSRRDGTTIEVEVAAIPFIVDGRGEVELIIYDRQPRVGDARALARREAELRLLLADLPCTVWTTDAAGRVTLTHPPGEDAPGLVHEPPVLAARAEALAGRRSTFEVTSSGRAHAVAMTPRRGAGGAVLGEVGLAIDLTEERRREAARRSDERIDGLAHLAGGVAHEVNNVLAIILGHATALHVAGSEARSDPDLEALLVAGDRASRIVSRLLGFAGGGMYRRQAVDTAALVRAAAVRAGAGAGSDAAIACEVAAPTPSVDGDSTQLAAVLDALVENALLATPAGGAITLRAGPVNDGGADLAGGGAEGRSWVSIEVSDTGAGMTEVELSHAFEPYRSSRGDGHGLGLAMVRGVVRHHGGRVALTSELGHGTTVRILLPAGAASARIATPPPRAPSAVTQPTPTLGVALVVDDEPLVRHASRRLVERLGYTVLEAASGPEALALVAAREVPLAFVLVDMRMPGMSGGELVRRLVARDPGVRVVVCTGYEADDETQALLALGHVGFLGKPYRMEELARQVALLGDAAVS